MRILPATAEDLPAIRWLLSFEDLPTADLSEFVLRDFFVLRDDSGVAGAVGLEPCGQAALLRSLVVSPDARGNGYGVALLQAAEDLARKRRMTTLYLLTTSTQRFFEMRGFRVVSRNEAPARIKATREFSDMCPSTAVLMVKP